MHLSVWDGYVRITFCIISYIGNTPKKQYLNSGIEKWPKQTTYGKIKSATIKITNVPIPK